MLAAVPLLIAWTVITALRLPQPHLSIWRGDISTVTLLILPALLILHHLTWEHTTGRRPMLLWRASLTIWRDAWYCSRCHVVFLSDSYSDLVYSAGLAPAFPPARLRSALKILAPVLVVAPRGTGR